MQEKPLDLHSMLEQIGIQQILPTEILADKHTSTNPTYMTG
jgi:hypothetical protein